MHTIGEYFDFQNGFAFKSEDFSATGRYKVVKIKELKDGTVRFFEDSASIDPPDGFDIEKYIIRKGDVLFALTGDPVSKPNPLSWVGRVSYYDYDEPALLNQRVCRAIPLSNIDPLFLYYFFRQDRELYGLAAKASGSASQANISTKTIQQHEVRVFDDNVRQRIVSLLSAVDQKIKLNEKISNNLEQQVFAYFSELFSCKEANGEVSDILLEETKSKIKVGEARDQKGDYPFYTSGLSIYQYPEYLVDGKHIYLNTGGNAGVKYYDGKAAYSTDTWCVFATGEMTDYLYVYFAKMIDEMQSRYFEGSALKHLQKKKLLDRPIYIPSQEELESFNSIAHPIFNVITNNARESKLLIAIRDTLLPKLFSGELDLSLIQI